MSVIIAARDEEEEIAACVRSVSWAREVLVVENDSSDATVERAREAGATVFSHPFVSIGAQRNAALARASEPWILVLDADERATPAFGHAMAALVAQPPAARGGAPVAYRVRRRNFFFGREIRHGGWERDRPVRVFPATLRYDERPVHEHVIVDGAVGELGEPLLHAPYASLDEYFEKLQRYSRGWAEQHWTRGRRASVADLLVRPWGRVTSMLLLRGGWRDGVHGVVLAVLAGVSVAAKYAQLWALERSAAGRSAAGRSATGGAAAGGSATAGSAAEGSALGGPPQKTR